MSLFRAFDFKHRNALIWRIGNRRVDFNDWVRELIFSDWFYNDKNKGRELSHILPEILKAQAALEAADEEEEEEDDDE